MLRELYKRCMSRVEELEREISQATKNHVFASVSVGDTHISDYELVVGSHKKFRYKVSKPLRKLRRAVMVMAVIRIVRPSSVSDFTTSEEQVNRLLVDLSVARSNETISEDEYNRAVEKLKSKNYGR